MTSTLLPDLSKCTIDESANNPDLPRQFTYAEVATAKRVQKQTVYEWVKRGMIPSPVYTGSTARFTEEHFGVIMEGPSVPGSYTPAPSPRAVIGKLGGPKPKKKPKAKKKGKPPLSPGKKSKAKVGKVTKPIPLKKAKSA